jgi:predicted MPP superfamily phosphohydrolase
MGITRRHFLTGFKRLFQAGVAVGAWSFGIEPGFMLRVQRYAFTPPNWTPGLKLRLVAIADIHSGGPHMSEARVDKVVDLANSLGGDAHLLLGDYKATHHFVMTPVPYERTASAFARLKSSLGTHAILGNHDWWDDPVAQKRRAGPVHAQIALEAEGIPVYENSGVRLEKDGHPFWLLGLADLVALRNPGRGNFTGRDDLPKALSLVNDDAPIVLMIHEPDAFINVPPRVSVTLAGHTHGGQVRLFGYSPIVPSSYGNRFAYGHVEEEGRHLFISGGLGCSNIPVRLGVPPEIMVLDLG